MSFYSTKPEDVILHETDLVPFTSGRLITAVPFMDRNTGLAARLNYATWLIACQLLGLTPLTYADVGELAEMVYRDAALCIEPVILPNEKYMTIPKRKPGESVESHQIRIRNEMSSEEWARIHDLECWRQIEAIGGIEWRNNPTPVMNFGKWFIGGAPKDRAYLRGWLLRAVRKFIQPGSTSGPGPHSALGVCDYGTLGMATKLAA